MDHMTRDGLVKISKQADKAMVSLQKAMSPNSFRHRLRTRKRYYAIRWRRATESKMHRRMVQRQRRITNLANEEFRLRRLKADGNDYAKQFKENYCGEEQNLECF